MGAEPIKLAELVLVYTQVYEHVIRLETGLMYLHGETERYRADITERKESLDERLLSGDMLTSSVITPDDLQRQGLTEENVQQATEQAERYQTRLTELTSTARDQRDRAYEELTGLISTDPLTGLLNRRAFGRRLEERISAFAQIGRRPGDEIDNVLVAYMIDVDHFKLYNDEFGHIAGDQALIGLAQVLQKVTRDDDTVARYGGEEFVVLGLVKRDQRDVVAQRIVEGIRTQLTKGTVINYDGARLPEAERTLQRDLRVSVGHAIYETGQNPETFLEHADQALYKAKQAGRDQAARQGTPAAVYATDRR